MAAGTAPSAWAALLHDLVVSEPASEQANKERMGEFVAALGGGGGGGSTSATPTPVVRLVEALGPYLTSDNDAQRARATAVLAEVVEAVPACASSADEVAHLAQFFAARLTDWPAVRGALRGCLALVTRRPAPADPAGAGVMGAGVGPSPGKQLQAQQGQRGPAGLPAPEEGDVVELLRVCVGHVFVRALAQPDRELALRLLAAAAARYGAALLGSNLDLLEYLISSVDGEKDPRCLLLCFEAVQALLALYHSQPEESLCHDRLEESAEELFEVLACYFPITFNPPPGDPNRISREDLAAGLQASLAAEPLFAPFLVPLAMEKLSSALRQAKLDSLSMLGACAASYGPGPLAPFTSTLWAALRSELAAPAAEGLLSADVPAADEVAAVAATCLERCLSAFQRGESGAGGGAPAGASLADAVLADHSMQDMLACIRSPGQDAAKHRRSVQRAKAGARAAAALCRAGGAAATKALGQLLPQLLDAVAVQAGAPAEHGSAGASGQSQCLGWAAMLELLQAAAAAPPADAAAAASANATLLQRAVSAAAAALAAAAVEQAAAEEAAMEVEGREGNGAAALAADRWPLAPADCTQRQAAALQLATLAAVFGCPPSAGAIQHAQVEAAITSVLQLLAVPGLVQEQQAAAVAPLAALAQSSYSTVLGASALPQLVAAAGEPNSAAAALAALQALAAASGSLRSEIMGALDRAIQQQLEVAAAQAEDSSGSAAQLLQQLLKAAANIVTGAASASASGAAVGAVAGQAAEAADSSDAIVKLGQHLFEAASQLPHAAADSTSPALQSACAELAYHAMRSTAAAQQAALAAAAAAALQQGQQLGGLQACIACALLVPLRPEVVGSLPGGPPASLVERLVQLAVAQQQEGPAAHWAALAAAALLNKWPADAASLSACTAAALQGQLYPACGLADAAAPSGTAAGASLPAAAPAAWACLAAVVRGLAMRGQREADGAISRAVAGLDAAAQQWQEEPAAALAGGVKAVAQFLGAVLEGSAAGAADSKPGLGRQSFATAKPLWQQRLYIAGVGQLMPLLQRSFEAHAQGRPGAGSAAPAEATASPPLLLALGQLLQAAPAAVLQQDQARLLPWLLQCLAALQQGPLADGPLLQALLLLLSNALMGDAGRREVEADLLPRLVPALLGAARFRPSPAVRETALQCLLLLLELPYTALHPYRRKVARVLAAAVDDDRRSVRLQAARVRQAWAAS